MLFCALACNPEASTPPAAPTPAPAAPPTDVVVEDIATDAQPAPTKPVAPTKQDPVVAAVHSQERSEADRALDSQREPVKLLQFFGIAPGQHVAELGAGGGYTAELLARVVGTEGKVYGQNSKFILERFAEVPWSERLKKPVMSNTVRLDTPFDAPFPEGVANLDAVLIVLFYHDTVWQDVDRAKMNASIFRALKPGGIYGVVDHSARKGDGSAHTKTLHRIEESHVVAEIQKAGFQLEERASFLENPDDPRDWNAAPSSAGERRGTSDRFVLRFRKLAAK
jgi:predicted methyltransferase